jgi:hypothetical protein
MTDGQAAGGARRIVLFFRNDLRLRDNVIVHQAVQKVKAGEYDEVRFTETCSGSSSSSCNGSTSCPALRVISLLRNP